MTCYLVGPKLGNACLQMQKINGNLGARLDDHNMRLNDHTQQIETLQECLSSVALGGQVGAKAGPEGNWETPLASLQV